MSQHLFAILFLSVFIKVECGHHIRLFDTPIDQYHNLHLPHEPPLFPTLNKIPKTAFNCQDKEEGYYYADLETACQVFHVCQKNRDMTSFLCTNGTLFNEQFQVCDQFYNVRCGSPYEDL